MKTTLLAAQVWGALGLGALLLLLGFPLGRDHQIFALVGEALLAGQRPYADVFDYKPPGIHLVMALARALTDQPIGLRALEALALGSLLPAFAVLSRRFLGDPRAGLPGAVVAIVGAASGGFWHTGQPETFAGVALAWALVAVSGPPGWASWIGAGALCGVAAVFKPTCALPLVVLAAWSSRTPAARSSPPEPLFGSPAPPAAGGSERERSLDRRPVDALLGLAAGAGAVGALTAGLYAALGALPHLVDAVFGFAVEHARDSYAEEGPLAHLVRATVDFLGTAPFACLALVPLLTLRPAWPEETRGRWLALGAVAASVVGVAMQGRFFLYHQTAAVVLVGLPAGWGAWKAALALPEALRGPAGLAAALGLASLVPSSAWSSLREGGPELEAGRSHRKLASFSQEDIEAVAKVVRQQPRGPLFVWGMEPGIYLATGRPLASRYVTNEPQRTWWSLEERRAELLEELERTSPAVVLVQEGDVIPFLLDTTEDSRRALEGFPELRHFLRKGYVRKDPVGSFEVWVRAPAAQGGNR